MEAYLGWGVPWVEGNWESHPDTAGLGDLSGRWRSGDSGLVGVEWGPLPLGGIVTLVLTCRSCWVGQESWGGVLGMEGGGGLAERQELRTTTEQRAVDRSRARGGESNEESEGSLLILKSRS